MTEFFNKSSQVLNVSPGGVCAMLLIAVLGIIASTLALSIMRNKLKSVDKAHGEAVELLLRQAQTSCQPIKSPFDRIHRY